MEAQLRSGFEMQASLALISGLLGLAGFHFERQWLAAAGGLLMLANRSYRFLAIIPTNKRLDAMADGRGAPRPLIHKWGRLHAVRTLLGLTASGAFLIAVASG